MNQMQRAGKPKGYGQRFHKLCIINSIYVLLKESKLQPSCKNLKLFRLISSLVCVQHQILFRKIYAVMWIIPTDLLVM